MVNFIKSLVILVLALVFVVAAENPANYVKGKRFDRVMIVVMENQGYISTLLHPNFKRLSKQGQTLDYYFAPTHPSFPNYLTMTAGDYFGIYDDDNHDLNKTSIVDLLEAKGISWKSYQEDYPMEFSGQPTCGTAHNYGLYYRKHNPFISFDNVRSNPNRCKRIVNSDQLWKDIANNDLPQYMFYTPNINNDCHNTGLTYCDKYIGPFMDKLLSSETFMKDTLVILTFDEDDYLEFNRIYTVLFGSMVPAGSFDSDWYSHYSLLKTVEDNWNLGDLGRHDKTSNIFKMK